MTAASPIDDCASELRILYLEDESLIAMNYVAMLEAAGAVVDDCTTLGAAFTALDEGTYDVALLDVNIRETMSFPLAAAALAKGLPVVFVTGYGKDVLPPEWSGHANAGWLGDSAAFGKSGAILLGDLLIMPHPAHTAGAGKIILIRRNCAGNRTSEVTTFVNLPSRISPLRPGHCAPASRV